MRRKLMMGILALALPAAAVVVVASPATAKPKPTFSGNASGTVTCRLPKLKISFSPPLTTANTGSDAITIKGTLKDCSNAGGNVTISSGKILSGTFTSSGGCAGLISGTTSPVELTIAWKGKSLQGGKATIGNSVVRVNGAAPAFNGADDVGFELPNPGHGGSITGSFAGSVTHESYAYSSTSATVAGADCSPTSKTTKKGTKTKPAKGIKKLSVKTGAITLP